MFSPVLKASAKALVSIPLFILKDTGLSFWWPFLVGFQTIERKLTIWMESLFFDDDDRPEAGSRAEKQEKTNKQIIAAFCRIITWCITLTAVIFVFDLAYLLWPAAGGAEFGVTGGLELGPFGDFFAGLLNPLFTLLMFVGLVITIVLQRVELGLTREELAGSAEALRGQVSIGQHQNFSNLFLILLKELEKSIAGVNEVRTGAEITYIQYYLGVISNSHSNGVVFTRLHIHKRDHEFIRLSTVFCEISHLLEENKNEVWAHRFFYSVDYGESKLLLLYLIAFYDYFEDRGVSNNLMNGFYKDLSFDGIKGNEWIYSHPFLTAIEESIKKCPAKLFGGIREQGTEVSNMWSEYDFFKRVEEPLLNGDESVLDDT